MNIEDFKKILVSDNSIDIVKKYLYHDSIHAISDDDEYAGYINCIGSDYIDADHISVMGSANWCFSLHPEKKFRPFNDKSDIDIVIVCLRSFMETWEELRGYHRNNYYLLSQFDRNKLRRNGENVYSGFISPKWIVDKTSKLRFKYEIKTNSYSNKIVGYRKVNMMYFKNTTEAIDYYVRGFRLAKNRI